MASAVPPVRALASAVPPVQWFKRSQTGLYGGKQRLSGNTISPSKRQ
jgi:hypothetical protein